MLMIMWPNAAWWQGVTAVVILLLLTCFVETIWLLHAVTQAHSSRLGAIHALVFVGTFAGTGTVVAYAAALIGQVLMMPATRLHPKSSSEEEGSHPAVMALLGSVYCAIMTSYFFYKDWFRLSQRLRSEQLPTVISTVTPIDDGWLDAHGSSTVEYALSYGSMSSSHLHKEEEEEPVVNENVGNGGIGHQLTHQESSSLESDEDAEGDDKVDAAGHRRCTSLMGSSSASRPLLRVMSALTSHPGERDDTEAVEELMYDRTCSMDTTTFTYDRRLQSYLVLCLTLTTVIDPLLLFPAMIWAQLFTVHQVALGVLLSSILFVALLHYCLGWCVQPLFVLDKVPLYGVSALLALWLALQAMLLEAQRQTNNDQTPTTITTSGV